MADTSPSSFHPRDPREDGNTQTVGTGGYPKVEDLVTTGAFLTGDGTTANPINLSAAAVAAIGSGVPGIYVATSSAFGATGDGVTDDRAAIQLAMATCSAAGGGWVILPPTAANTYVVGQAPGSPFKAYCLDAPANVTLLALSRATVLKQAPGVAAAVRLLHVATANVRVCNLTLDGNTANQSVQANLQRHGIFAEGSDGLVVVNCDFRNFAGDGLYLFTGVTNTCVANSSAHDNDRNGFTVNSATNSYYENCHLYSNKAQQFDTEPSPTFTYDGVTLVGCVLGPAGPANDFVCTVSGSDNTHLSTKFKMVDCTLLGTLECVFQDGIDLEGCTIISPTPNYALYIHRLTKHVRVVGCRIESTQDTVDALGVVGVVGTAANDRPADLVFADCHVIGAHAKSHGFDIRGPSGTVDVHDCRIEGPGTNANGFAGIKARATFNMDTLLIRGNHIKGHGQYGVQLAGSAANTIADTHITDNSIGSVTNGVNLDDTTGAAVQVEMAGNAFNSVTNPVINYPAAAAILTGGTRGAAGTYSTASSPEGVVAEQLGALAVARDTGLVYSKRSNAGGNTGWVALP